MRPIDDPSDELRWSIPGRNSAGEHSTVTVLVMGDRVAVVLPPGDTLIFDPEQAADLAAVLDKAATSDT